MGLKKKNRERKNCAAVTWTVPSANFWPWIRGKFTLATVFGFWFHSPSSSCPAVACRSSNLKNTFLPPRLKISNKNPASCLLGYPLCISRHGLDFCRYLSLLSWAKPADFRSIKDVQGGPIQEVEANLSISIEGRRLGKMVGKISPYLFFLPKLGIFRRES